MSLQDEIQEMLEAAEVKEPLIFARELPIYRQLKLKRIHDGFMLVELAPILGMGVSTLSQIENNNRRIPPKYLERVKSYLYCEMYSNKGYVGYVDQSW